MSLTGATPGRWMMSAALALTLAASACSSSPKPTPLSSGQPHLFWGNDRGTTVGGANLDGSASTQNFIVGANKSCGVAVEGKYVFWANEGGTTIGRANLDGSAVNQSFISG